MFSTRYHKQFFFAILLRNISSFEYIKSNNLLFIIRSIFLSDNKLHQRTSGTSHFIILCVYFPKQWQLAPQSFLGTVSLLMQASESAAHCFIRVWVLHVCFGILHAEWWFKVVWIVIRTLFWSVFSAYRGSSCVRW